MSAERRDDTTRIEGFSDAIFGFAATLLVVSLEVPKDFASLTVSLKGFIAFGLSFAVLAGLWTIHRAFFRRYQLGDLVIVHLVFALVGGLCSAVALTGAGMRILRNEVAPVNGLDVIGVDDLWARRCDPAVALRARSNTAALVLVHNPDAADRAPWSNYRGWMLAGHTHGGQCKPPFLPPPLLPVDNPRYVAGAVSVDARRTLYISRGVGHLIRARFNVRPEATVFTLRNPVAHVASTIPL